MLFLSTVAAVPATAIAQSRTALEEIVVTAQKREEALQDVPIAISAISADALTKQGIANLNDFQNGQVPSLKVVEFAGRPNTLQLGIRGVTESDPAQLTIERPVAVYVDGVYVARGNGLDTEVFDIERMEILRGPQGTLFGRNAMGGALNISTRKPKGEFGFKQDLEASSLDEYKARTLIDTPEWNGLAASLGYVHREANGWIGNPGQRYDFNYQDKDAYRIALQYSADTVVVDYSYDRSDVEYMQNYNVLVHKPAASLNPRPAAYGRVERAWAGASNPLQTTESFGHNLSVEWEISDSVLFKSITGYRELEDVNNASGSGANAFLPGQAGTRNPLTPAFMAFSNSTTWALTEQDQISQEFQLIGEIDRLEWQTGVMYFKETGSFTGGNGLGYIYNCPGATANFVTSQFTGYGANCGMPAMLPLNFPTAGLTITNVSTESYGVYGQATWNPDILDDRLRITLGLRYGVDDKDISRPVESGVRLTPPNTTNPTSERVDPALTVAYSLLDDTSVYVRYSTAYRSGGASTREIQTFTPYEEEEVEASEIGVKSVFWDNRARINAAAFYTETDNFLVSVQQVCNDPVTGRPLCSTANTQMKAAPGKARMSGFELDSSVLVIEGLTLSVSYSYLDNALPEIEFLGSMRQPYLNNAPRNSWSAGIDYDFEPFSFGKLNAHMDVTDSSSFCFNIFSCKEDSYAIAGDITGVQGGKDNRLVNARLTLSEIPVGAGAVTAALWGKNLTDAEPIQFGYTAPSNMLFGNNTVAQYGAPRSYGVTLTYEY
jgi:iron complex outermembrane receptor protein